MFEQYPEQLISSKVLKENEAGRAEHILTSGGIPMGNLTAGMLGDPYQWIMLKMIGISSREPDEYALRLFKRGNHVEEWFIDMIKPVDSQVDVQFLGATGRVDAIVDTAGWQNDVGIIPLEVKSVKNSAFKWIVGNSKRPGTAAKRGHRLQATLYALALGADHYAVTYIAADDYRTVTYVYRTADTADEVRKIIGTAQAYLEAHVVPKFESIEDWQANPQYCKFPTYQFLEEDEILEKLLREQPDAFRRLMGTTRDELVREKESA